MRPLSRPLAATALTAAYFLAAAAAAWRLG